MELLNVMAAVYDSEINCAVWSFWDGGFTVALGDEVNGWKDKMTFWERGGWREAGRWLHEAALKHCPNSDYAKSWQELGEEAP